MPSQESISARINFGVPNSEYILKANKLTGAAISCYNQDTGTEYIGGGGGGDSDFSTAAVLDLALTTGIHLRELPELCYIIPSPTGDVITSVGKSYRLTSEGPEYKIVLYKNLAQTFLEAQTPDAYNITVTGNISYEYSEDEAGFIILIRGDGTIEIEQPA